MSVEFNTSEFFSCSFSCTPVFSFTPEESYYKSMNLSFIHRDNMTADYTQNQNALLLNSLAIFHFPAFMWILRDPYIEYKRLSSVLLSLFCHYACSLCKFGSSYD
jgi:hypothetical protein